MSMNKATLFVSALCLLVIAASAGTLTIGSMPYKANIRVNPFPSMPMSQFAMLEGATVSIEYGYAAGFDRLTVDYPGEFPIEGEFNAQTGTLHLTGLAPISEYNIAIATVVFSTSAEDGARRRITWTYGRNTYFMTSTEHFYQFVPRQVAWEQAHQACALTTYMGQLKGYLATITSDAEMYEVGYKVNYTAWLGGNGIPSTGEWKWVAGPEGALNSGQGYTFWQGLSLYKGGQTPANSTAYANWFRFMPDANTKNVTITDSNYQGSAYWSDASNEDGVPGYVCEFGGFDYTAGVLSSAISSFAGSIDLTLQCALFTESAECNNHGDLGCSWNGQSCQQTSCTRHRTERNCVADPSCDWDLNGPTGACVSSRCSVYSGETACNADLQCSWSSSASGARACLAARCEAASTTSACAAINNCVQRGFKCGFDSGVNCNGVDVVYLLDGTSVLGGNFGKSTQGFFGLTQAFIEAQQVLTGNRAGQTPSTSDFGQRVGFIQYGGSSIQATPTGTGSAGRLTGDRGELVADLTWHQSRFNSNANTRTISDALRAAATMFGASGSREKVLVIFAAGEISDSTAAVNANLISALSGVKVVGVALQPTPVTTFNSWKAATSLSTLTPNVVSITLQSVTSVVVYGLCGTAPNTIGGLVRSNVPNLLCSAYPSRSICNADKLCAWDPSSLSCQNTGCMKLSATACSSNPTCVVDGSNCVTRCPTLNSASCATNSQCSWNAARGFCDAAPCLSIPTEDGCIAAGDGAGTCVFNAARTPACQARRCLYDNQNACVADTANACAWSTDGGVDACFQSQCAGLSQAACGSLVQCSWNGGLGRCDVGYCGFHVNEKNCAADRKCLWNVGQTPAACGPQPCRILNNDADPRTACAANPSCVWSLQSQNGYADMCVPLTCDYITTSCGCAAMSGCVWRNDQCRDSRFVQCKPTDVVFLVEATNNMNMAFGRHPNGFIGIVEAIRTWSRQAPLSSTIDAAGFRLGFVGYGATTPLVTAQGSGAGGNLTNNINTWAEPKQELDQIEAQQATIYANGAGSNVAINPGLQAAKAIFEANTAGNRNRILIILGASPITDGASNLELTISELEKLNVQIFTTVIRRFSSITNAEQLAATFLRPIASDPSQLHFLFTTIDDMQRNLLDDFCDPTSNTGIALGIDRNKVLPCDWLQSASECNMQATCQWNATAQLRCPQASQCPQLNCMTLPASLISAGFTCQNCILKSGAFECSLQTINRPPTGLCQKAPCSYSCQSTCSADPSCLWSTESSRCEQNMCGNVATCQSNPGCTLVANGATPTCRRSICAYYRSATSCSAATIQDTAGSSIPACVWDDSTTPGLCLEQHCYYLSPTACAADATCIYSADAAGFKCQPQTCTHTTSETCEMDANCYWNPFATTVKKCFQRTSNCEISGYSKWSACSASCGTASVQYKARSIVQFPADVDGAVTCPQQAAVACLSADGQPPRDPTCDIGDTMMIQSRSCTSAPGWPTNCATYCSQYTTSNNVLGCAMDISCEWKAGACVAKATSGCASLSTPTSCNAADICAWNGNLNFCEETIKACRFNTSATCQAASRCNWMTGSDANALATQLGTPVQLINPGQPEIFVFPLIKRSTSQTIVNGATVTIESGYVRGKDLLELTYPTSINSQWLVQSGTLKLFGAATVAEYINAIRAVTFFTTSTRTAPRTVTYSFGNSTVFSTATGHHYRAMSRAGTTYDAARTMCEQSTLYGLSGYLATITSASENTIVATKLAAEGWISGTDVTRNTWKLSSGPANENGVTFWSGLSAAQGGATVGGSYANWDSDQPAPTATPGGSHPYLTMSGLWDAVSGDASTAAGFICEYGGMPTDQPNDFAVGGAMVLGVGGCVPTTCAWHVSADQCSMNVECQWTGTRCIAGCSQRSTVTECQTGNNNCKWDTDITPPVCDINQCVSLGQSACTLNPKCQWSATTLCTYKTGCGQYASSTACNNRAECSWSASTSTCSKKPCNINNQQTACQANPLCEWNGGVCASIACKYGNAADCTADRECSWSDAQGASGAFAPGGTRMLPFASGTQAPDDIQTQIDGITVMIVDGFQQGQDVLTVDAGDNIAGNYIITYNEMTGVLTLRVSPGVTVSALGGYNFMRQFVKFYSSSTSLARRVITYTLGLNTFYTSTHSYFKWYDVDAATFSAASSFCQGNSYFGLSGQLANVQEQMDNLRLIALGARGWIGAQVDSNQAWSWVPQNTLFWTGAGAVGLPTPSTSFAQWAAGEPSDRATAGSGAFLTISGMWRSMPAGVVPSRGVICQFGTGSTRASSVVNGARSIMPQGCYKTPCLGNSKTYCTADPQCIWRSATSTCVQDSFCPQATNVSSCNNREICFWDYTVGACRTAPTTFCNSLGDSASCNAQSSQCQWVASILARNATRGSGACQYKGCRKNPTKESCTADSTCRWAQASGSPGTCVSRLCGYQTATQCWGDAYCMYTLADGCKPSECYTKAQADCTGECFVNNGMCQYKRCSATTQDKCMSDPDCLFTSGSCSMPNCRTKAKSDCEADRQCFFDTTNPGAGCTVAQCSVNTDKTRCEAKGTTGVANCKWIATESYCQDLTSVERAAPATSPSSCEREEEPNLWWLWLLLAIIFLLLAGIMYRLYLAYSKGLSFFEPARNRKAFSPHQQYAQDLFESAKETAVETNTSTYNRPSLNDL